AEGRRLVLVVPDIGIGAGIEQHSRELDRAAWQLDGDVERGVSARPSAAASWMARTARFTSSCRSSRSWCSRMNSSRSVGPSDLALLGLVGPAASGGTVV